MWQPASQPAQQTRTHTHAAWTLGFSERKTKWMVAVSTTGTTDSGQRAFRHLYSTAKPCGPCHSLNISTLQLFERCRTRRPAHLIHARDPHRLQAQLDAHKTFTSVSSAKSVLRQLYWQPKAKHPTTHKPASSSNQGKSRRVARFFWTSGVAGKLPGTSLSPWTVPRRDHCLRCTLGCQHFPATRGNRP